MLKYRTTPVNEILDKEIGGCTLLIKREDLNHPFISGNKWWKLKYNLEEAKRLNRKVLLTFGGAYSNHIYATAAAAKGAGFKSIGIIRGEESLPLNSTLSFAKDSGMDLQYISREEYQRRSEPEFIERLVNRFGDIYLIPEGGTNEFALKGCYEFARQELIKIDFDYLCLPVGTGGTIAGIIAGLEEKKKIIGFSVLKDGGFLNDQVLKLVKSFSGKEFSNWHIETGYHFGGYAKRTNELDQFISRMKTNHNLSLEFVYTGKMMAGIFDLISKNYFDKGSRILALHTGGLRN